MSYCKLSFLFSLLFLLFSQLVKAQGAHDIELRAAFRNDSNGLQVNKGEDLGRDLTWLKDMDGDGVNELAVSHKSASEGEVLILYLNKDLSVKSTVKIKPGESGLPSNLSTNTRSFGSTLERIPDMDNDGVDELIASNPANDFSSSPDGEIFLLFLNKNGSVKKHVRIGENEGGLDTSFSVNEQFGTEVTVIRDLDGDNVDDLAVGSVHGNSMGLDPGAVWILFLNTNGTVKDFHLLEGGSSGFSTELSDDGGFGNGIGALGDYNNNGQIDLAVGELRSSSGCDECGALWLLELNTNGTVSNHQRVNWSTQGMSSNLKDAGGFGYSVVSGYSLDSDDVKDIITIHSYDLEGKGYRALDFIYLNKDGSIKEHQVVSENIKKYQYTFGHKTRFANNVDILPDMDGDGKLDLFISSYSHDVDEQFDFQGKFYLFSMDGPVITDVDEKVASEDFHLYPNPSTGAFSIEGLPTEGKYELRILDMHGQEVFRKQIDNGRAELRPQLAEGMYLLQLSNEQKQLTKKLIVR